METNFNDPPLHFVLGRERSGTTLLQTILDGHPEIIAPAETPFIKHLYQKYHSEKHWTSKKLEAFLNDLKDEPYIKQWNIDWEKLYAGIQSLSETVNFSTLCKFVYFFSPSAVGKKHISLIIDKNPQYCLFVKKLRVLYPQAKFIFITRDYRDQVQSMLKVNFEAKVVAALAYRWKHFNKLVFDQVGRHPSLFYHVKYEDLIDSPDASLKDICRFLQIEFNESMLKNKDRAELILKDNLLKDTHHSSLQQPIDKNRKDLWKKNMKDFDVKQCDLVAGKFAERIGYVRKYQGFSAGVFLHTLPGLIYGRLYFFFLDLLDALPYGLKKWVNANLVYRMFGFWKTVGRKN